MLFVSTRKPNVQSPRRRVRRRTQDGTNLAALRAIAAAADYVDRRPYAPTLRKAAAAHGTSASYVQAAVTLLNSGDRALVWRVLRGKQPLFAAAAEARPLAKLVEAHRKAPASALAQFDRTLGADALLARAIQIEFVDRVPV